MKYNEHTPFPQEIEIAGTKFEKYGYSLSRDPDKERCVYIIKGAGDDSKKYRISHKKLLMGLIQGSIKKI